MALTSRALCRRVAKGQHGAFQRLERGELTLGEFYTAFAAELADPDSMALYRQYLARRGKPIGARALLSP